MAKWHLKKIAMQLVHYCAASIRCLNAKMKVIYNEVS